MTNKKINIVNATICFFYLSFFLVNYSYYLDETKTVYNVTSFIVKLLCILLFLVCIIKCHQIINYKMVLIALVLFAFLLFNMLISISIIGYISEVSIFVESVAPLIALMFIADDYFDLMKKMVFLAKIIGVFSLAFVFLNNMGAYSYGMGLSNSLVLPCMVLLFDYIRNKKRISFVFACIIVVDIFAFGSRGALLGVAVFFVIIVLKEIVTKNNLYRNLILLLLFSLIVLFNRIIIMVFQKVLESAGVYSRTLYLFLNDTGHLSGREIIYKKIVYELKENPLTYRGIGGAYSITEGANAHNIFLQIFIENGVVIGTVLAIMLIYCIIKTFYGFREKSMLSIFIIITFSASIPRLMFSGSVWSSVELWLWLVLLLKKRLQLKKLKYENNSC